MSVAPDGIFELGSLGADPEHQYPSHRTSRTKSDLEADGAVINRIGRPSELNVRKISCPGFGFVN